MKKFALAMLLLVCLVLALASCELGAKEITYITVDPESYTGICLVGSETPDFSAIKVEAHYKDGTSEKVENSLVTVDASAVNTAVAGEYTVTVEYKEVTAHLTVTVTTDIDRIYEIDDFELPASISLFLTKQEQSRDPEEAAKEAVFKEELIYRVGDDNPFKFLPNITVWDEDDRPVSINAYRSVSTVHEYRDEQWVQLQGTELTDTVAINETTSEYDFTDAAVGRTFRLTVRPYYLPEDAEEEEYTLSFEFCVVDGYNVYDAANLSRFDNTNQRGYWASFKQAHGIEDIKINGIVLHTNLTLANSDIASGYFNTEADTADSELLTYMKDVSYLYNRTLAEGESFAFYGNGFIIDASEVMPVHQKQYGEDFSNSCLFMINGTNTDRTYSGTASSVVRDISFIGNAGRNNDFEETKRSLGGLICFKFVNDNSVLENCLVKSFFIGVFPELNTKIQITSCRVCDSLQDAMFIWSGTDVRVDSTDMLRCGGPLIIMQHNDPSAAGAENRYPTLTVSEDSRLESFVSGQEVWFVNMNQAATVSQLVGMSNIIAANSTALAQAGLLQNGKTLTDNAGRINVVAVVMSNGVTVSSSGVQGKITLDGAEQDQQLANLISGENLVAQGMISVLSPLGAIVLQTSGADKVVWTDGNDFYVDAEQTTLGSYIGSTGDASFFTGDYFAIYMNNMCVVLQLLDVK